MYKIFNKSRRVIKRKWYALIYFVKDIILRDKVLVNYWIPPKSDPEFYNFGDDLNRGLIELISGKTVIPYRFSRVSKLKKSINYICIGSVISQLTNEQTIVWGGSFVAGVTLENKPLKVLAVRGPLSREYLVKNGVECPKSMVIRDPAIEILQAEVLGKEVYNGNHSHYIDKNNPVLDAYRKLEEVYIFDMQNYGSYQQFVDTLCACEFIISSSLHGLIVSDSYNIPNAWVEFSSGIVGGHFKFRDYFLSVQRSFAHLPIAFKTFIPVAEWQELASHWQPPKLDDDQLMSVCPFNRTTTW